MKIAHNNALAENLEAKIPTAAYSKFQWFACRSTIPLILGDSVIVFETNGARRFKPYAPDITEITRIYLPLSASAILVGTLNKAKPFVDFNRVNKASARCSLEFLISSRKLPAGSHFIESMGVWAGLLSSSDRDTLLNTPLELFE